MGVEYCLTAAPTDAATEVKNPENIALESIGPRGTPKQTTNKGRPSPTQSSVQRSSLSVPDLGWCTASLGDAKHGELGQEVVQQLEVHLPPERAWPVQLFWLPPSSSSSSSSSSSKSLGTSTSGNEKKVEYRWKVSRTENNFTKMNIGIENSGKLEITEEINISKKKNN